MKHVIIALFIIVGAILGTILKASQEPSGRVYVLPTPDSYSLPVGASSVNTNRTAAPTDFLAEGDQVWVGDHYWIFHSFDGRLFLSHRVQGQDRVVKSEEELATPQAIDGVNGEGPVFLVGPVIRSKNGPAVLIVRGYETGPKLEIRAVFPVISMGQRGCQIGLEEPGDLEGKWVPYEGSGIYAFGKLLMLDFPMGFSYLYHHDDGTYSGGFVGITIIEPSVEGPAVNLVYHCAGNQWMTFKNEGGIWYQLVP